MSAVTVLPARDDHRWWRRARVIAGVMGAALAATTAFAATNWIVGLSNGSSGAAQSSTISNLSISAVASPAAGNLLYPGGTGDVVLSISNPNSFPVTVTDVQLPANSSFAVGYSDAALTAAQTGCDATNSAVTWNYATATAGTTHTLTTPLTVAANGTLTVTFTNDAAMGSSAPAACAGTYFRMPSLAGVTATGGAATPTTGPVTDSWTS